MNGFQNRCLRSIWGILPSYQSLVSNQRVLEIVEQTALSTLITRQQLILLDKVAQEPDGSLLRDSTFSPGTYWPATDMYIRRRRRPRLEWVKQVCDMAWRISPEWKQEVTDAKQWKKTVSNFTYT